MPEDHHLEISYRITAVCCKCEKNPDLAFCCHHRRSRARRRRSVNRSNRQGARGDPDGYPSHWPCKQYPIQQQAWDDAVAPDRWDWSKVRP